LARRPYYAMRKKPRFSGLGGTGTTPVVPGNGLPPIDPGYAYLVDLNGDYLVDDDGNYLVIPE
jgi:hypothetical protein